MILGSTQATTSRDIKELRAVKELTSLGTYRHTASAKDGAGTFSARLNTIFRECITSFDYAQNIIIIMPMPGPGPPPLHRRWTPRICLWSWGRWPATTPCFLVMRDEQTPLAAFCGEIKSLPA
ncbi:MAG: arginine repressor [Oscillospiraceae bacterium]